MFVPAVNAATTFSVSVTSAPVSIPFNLVLSSSVIAPQAEVVAAGIEAFVPSEELITKEVPLAVVDRFVVTFSTTVTAPVFPFTLVTASVGVASSV